MKGGATGATGVTQVLQDLQGPQGEVGPQGPQGPPGSEGGTSLIQNMKVLNFDSGANEMYLDFSSYIRTSYYLTSLDEEPSTGLTVIVPPGEFHGQSFVLNSPHTKKDQPSFKVKADGCFFRFYGNSPTYLPDPNYYEDLLGDQFDLRSSEYFWNEEDSCWYVHSKEIQ